MVEIKENDFIRAEDARLKALSDYIRGSGLSLYAIAAGCRISWRTVKKAVDCVPVHGSTESRIRLFIERNGNGSPHRLVQTSATELHITLMSDIRSKSFIRNR